MEQYAAIDKLKHDKKKVMTVSEFMDEYCIGHNKAYSLIHCKGFPVVFCGRKALIIRNKVDEWFLEHLGDHF
ncbi:DNA-binding protein [Clostridium sp. JN-1]|uniref:DNA-binding protein n=1 Tax=Clostridium sp. JN-1 TaxID=2483110 RepID=UPI000F0B289D|nr:DNA-binding protein [Clostridium sp. JN-1]